MRDESVGSATTNRSQAPAWPLSWLQFSRLNLADEAARIIAEERGDHTKHRIAEAAGFPADWRGNWDALGRWLREDLDIDARVLTAIRRKAAWLKERGIPVAAAGIFDQEVRQAQTR